MYAARARRTYGLKLGLPVQVEDCDIQVESVSVSFNVDVMSDLETPIREPRSHVDVLNLFAHGYMQRRTVLVGRFLRKERMWSR
jgi:hypothetical protein